MRSCVVTSGAVFALLAPAHLRRVAGADPGLATDPACRIVTAAAAALGVRARRVRRGLPRPG